MIRTIRLTAALAAIAAASLASCSILGADSLGVAAWSPSEKSIADPSTVSIWVEFSSVVDARSTESAFSLKGDGAKVEGRFSWSGARLTFVPFDPLRKGVDYLLSVSTDAETASGISLGEPFEFRFETRTESARPFVSSVLPADDGILDNANPEIVLRFSEIVDMEGFLENVSVSPTIRGYWTHAAIGSASELTFHPAEPYVENEYRLRVGSSLTDSDGNEMADDFEARFFLSSDDVPPSVVSVSYVGGAGSSALAEDFLDDAAMTVNHGMNADDELEFAFSEPVTLDSFKSAFGFDPDAPVEYVTTASPTAVVRVKFGQRLAWGSTYTVTVGKGLTDEHGNKASAAGTWLVRVDGTRTRPPEPLAAAFKESAIADGYLAGTVIVPGPDWGTLLVSGYPSLTTSYATYIDLYVRTAPGAAVDLFSLMKSLSFSTYGSGTGATTVKATSVSAKVLADVDPPDLDLVRAAVGDAALADVGIVRVMVGFKPGSIGNVLSVELASGLSDDSGNASPADTLFLATLGN